MRNGNMCCAVVGNVLMACIGPDVYADALSRTCTREVDFMGRALKRFVYVDPPGFDEDNRLREWMNLCLSFTGSMPAK